MSWIGCDFGCLSHEPAVISCFARIVGELRKGDAPGKCSMGSLLEDFSSIQNHRDIVSQATEMGLGEWVT